MISPKHFHAAFAAALVLSSACYEYVPESTVPAASGRRVHLVIAPAAMTAIAHELGPNTRDVEGVIAAADSQRIVLDVVRVHSLNGFDTYMTGTRATIPRSALETLEIERVSPSRSAVAVGIGAVATFVAVRVFAIGSSPNATGSGGSRPPSLRAP